MNQAQIIQSSTAWQGQKKILFLGGFIFVLNLIYKGLFISENSIGLDEPFSIYHAQLSIDQIWEILRQGNNPPLYEMMLHYWIKLGGIGEFWVRFPSLIFNAVTAVFILLMAYRSFNIRVGVTSALIFTFSNYQIFFAHEARVYALFGMLAVCSMYVFMRWYSASGGALRQMILLILINALMIYSHYFGFFLIAFQTAFVFTVRPVREQIAKSYVIYVLVLAVLYLPNFFVLVNRFLDSAGNGTWVKSPNELGSLYEMFRQFTNVPVVAVVSLILFILVTVLTIFKRPLNEIKSDLKLMIGWFFGLYFLMFILSYSIPMFVDRYLIFISAPIVILIALAADSIFENYKLRLMAGALIVLLFALTSNPTMDNKRHVRELVEKVKEMKTKDTFLVFCPGDFNLNFAYYYDPKIFSEIDSNDPYKKLNAALIANKILGISDVSEISNQPMDRLIYIDAGADFLFPDNGILPFLQENGRQLEKHKFEEIYHVYLFEMGGG